MRFRRTKEPEKVAPTRPQHSGLLTSAITHENFSSVQLAWYVDTQVVAAIPVNVFNTRDAAERWSNKLAGFLLEMHDDPDSISKAETQ